MLLIQIWICWDPKLIACFHIWIWCLDVMSTHKPTMRHSHPHHLSAQHSVHCDNLLLWHFDPLTFHYYDRWTQWHFTTATLRPPFDTSRSLMSTPPKSMTFWHCNRTFTFFYLDCDRTSTFAPKWNVDVLSQVTRDHLEAFQLVSRGVE